MKTKQGRIFQNRRGQNITEKYTTSLTDACDNHERTDKTMAIKDKNTIELVDLKSTTKTAIVTIEGDGDIVLNKMNARNTRMLLSDDRKAAAKEKPNPWEDIITAIHWRDGIPCKDTYTECNEEMMYKLLAENAPCITAFGLKKAFGQAVVRNEIDRYATKLETTLNVVADKGIVPITFAEWSLDERLMAPKKGSPVVVRLNHFSGWRASFRIDYTESVYSINEFVNIINLAGFGLGIGSGRSSGYGRFHVTDVK